MQATLKNEEICCTGKVSSLGENNMDYIENDDKEKRVEGEKPWFFASGD